MTTISIADIKQVLHNLLNNQLTREEANNWAYKLMQKAENADLEYIPKQDEALIWESIAFLLAADLLNAPGVYFYEMEDFQIFLNKIEHR